jgi:hypothetical protein
MPNKKPHPSIHTHRHHTEGSIRSQHTTYTLPIQQFENCQKLQLLLAGWTNKGEEEPWTKFMQPLHMHGDTIEYSYKILGSSKWFFGRGESDIMLQCFSAIPYVTSRRKNQPQGWEIPGLPTL